VDDFLPPAVLSKKYVIISFCLNGAKVKNNHKRQKSMKDVNRSYSKFETSSIEIIDKHIPIKKRKPVAYLVPYMHQNLRNFSHKIMLLFDFIPLFDKKGLMVG
jgi:hypothetical protein